jgi:hypothetical protein
VVFFVSGGRVLALEHLGIDAAGVPPCTDDLSVAARGVESRAGLTCSFPPCRQRAISAVVEASRFGPYACNPSLIVSDRSNVSNLPNNKTRTTTIHALVDIERLE